MPEKGVKMKVKYGGNYGYLGTSFEDVEEFDDDTPDDVIEDTIRELVMQQVDWHWEKLEN